MNLGQFSRHLKKLNKNLWVIAKDTGKAAGVNIRHWGQWVNVCSIDKNEIPRFPIREKLSGRYIKGGWQRVLKMLIDKRFIDRHEAEKEFRTGLEGPSPFWKPELDPTLRTMNEIDYQRGLHSGHDKNGYARLKTDDVMDMASVIRQSRRR